MFKANGSRRDFPLRPGPMVIGRKNSCELRIPLSSVSRQHCEVTLGGGKVKLRDLGSSNGTYHNSIRVQEAELAAGDEVVVGPVVFTLVIDGVPDEIKPVRTIVTSGDAGDSNATVAPLEGVAVSEVEVISSVDTTERLDPGDPEEEPDPFEALEAMASQEREAGGGMSDSSLIDFDLDDLDDDDPK
ncbi:MAG: FHA domain-containing protein [Planctomycetota bacterium]